MLLCVLLACQVLGHRMELSHVLRNKPTSVFVILSNNICSLFVVRNKLLVSFRQQSEPYTLLETCFFLTSCLLKFAQCFENKKLCF